MEELLKQMVINAPQTALLAIMLWTLYNDWKADRAQASQERQNLLDKIDKLRESIDKHQDSVERLADAVRNGKPAPPQQFNN